MSYGEHKPFICFVYGFIDKNYDDEENLFHDSIFEKWYFESFFKAWEMKSVLSIPCIKAISCLLQVYKSRTCLFSKLPEDVFDHILLLLWSSFELSFVDDIKSYYRPMYGTDFMKERYLGFDFYHHKLSNRSLYDVYEGIYCLCPSQPPKLIQDIYQKHYGDVVNLEAFALIQNAYTSHYVSGNIMYGYYFNVEDDDCLSSHSLDANLEIVIIDHLYKNEDHFKNEDYLYFVGVILDEIDGVEKPKDAARNATVYQKRYDTKDIENLLPPYEDIAVLLDDLSYINMTHYPVITFIPTMCSCCT